MIEVMERNRCALPLSNANNLINLIDYTDYNHRARAELS